MEVALKKLLEDIEYTLVCGDIDINITGMAYDSRKITEGMLFVALDGTVQDGHKYIPQVVEKKAAVIVVEKDTDYDYGEATVIKVKEGRKALSKMSAAFFDYPLKKMTSIAITGTKGKSTVTYMVKDIIEKAGKSCGIIGTIGIYIQGDVTPTENTTPESFELHKAFNDMVNAGCDYVVMEVSSQAIKMDRVYGIEFDYGMFTNLYPDHIGPNEHKDFDEYRSCKADVFKMCKVGVFNNDDENFSEITKNATCKVYTYGTKDADLLASNIEHVDNHDKLSMKFSASGLFDGDIVVGIPGSFNILNGAGAVALAKLLELPDESIVSALNDVKVKGRVENVPTGRDFSILVDFAHNGVSSESVLTTLREYKPNRLIAIFGCGGNRSKLRRYEMGEAIGKLADFAIVTSDNPRTEKFEDIVEDIKVGLAKTDGEYIVIQDREEAVKYAVDHAQTKDMIVLLGKGHEQYQEINGVKNYYSEVDACNKALGLM